MKNWIFLAFLALPVSVCAQSIDLPVTGPVDLSSVIGQARAAYIFDQHRESLAGVYLPLIQFHDAQGRELVAINGGAIWQTGNGIGGPMVNVGLRLDNFADRWGAAGWMQSHAIVSKLPSIELGPFGGWIRQLGWLYGLYVSKRIGQ